MSSTVIDFVTKGEKRPKTFLFLALKVVIPVSKSGTMRLSFMVNLSNSDPTSKLYDLLFEVLKLHGKVDEIEMYFGDCIEEG